MSDPKLRRTTVVVRYAANDGFCSELKMKGGIGTKQALTGKPVPPEQALIEGLEELARLTALFGFEAEALEAFNGARQRVAEWKSRRSS